MKLSLVRHTILCSALLIIGGAAQAQIDLEDNAFAPGQSLRFKRGISITHGPTLERAEKMRAKAGVSRKDSF